MRTLRFLLVKEFLQIFRNKGMLPIIVLLPIIQLIVLAYAANYEVKDIRIIVVDQDHSPWSRQLISKLTASPYFQMQATVPSEKLALKNIEAGQGDLALVIPPHFSRTLIGQRQAPIQVRVNAITGRKAAIAAGYLQHILRRFTADIALQWAPQLTAQRATPIAVRSAFWYNPHMDYKQFMVPGILVVLVTMIGAFLSGMNVVREKEIGTMEQLNVTPISKGQFIIGKLLPFWIIAMVELAFGLLLSKLLFNLSFTGSVGWIFLFAALYLPVMLGMGLLISVHAETQQQALFVTWFFFVIFLLLSGLFTPIASMPAWAQQLTAINPVRWFIKVIRMVLLKGSSWPALWPYFLIIAAMALIINVLAVAMYKKRA